MAESHLREECLLVTLAPTGEEVHEKPAEDSKSFPAKPKSARENSTTREERENFMQSPPYLHHTFGIQMFQMTLRYGQRSTVLHRFTMELPDRSR